MKPTETQVDRALRRLTELNNFAFELNQAGRRAGLHDRVPWRERLEQVPPDAVLVRKTFSQQSDELKVAESAPEYGEKSHGTHL